MCRSYIGLKKAVTKHKNTSHKACKSIQLPPECDIERAVIAAQK